MREFKSRKQNAENIFFIALSQTQKAPLVGAFFAFGFDGAIRAIPPSGLCRRAGSLGECGCALPVADEAQSHECAACPRLRRARQVCLWQTLRVAEVKRASARADRCGHRNRDMFAHTFRVTPQPCYASNLDVNPKNPDATRHPGFLYPFFKVQF